jgi:hypothetical protein
MVRKRSAVVYGAVGSAIALAVGCELFVGVKDLPLGDAGTASSCLSALPPPKPDAASGGDVTVQMALRSLDLGIRLQADAGKPLVIGYNLDGVCTCPDPESCVPHAVGTHSCDDVGGIDNAGRNALQTVASQTNGLLDQTKFNVQIGLGTWTYIVRIRHYDGLADDDQIEAALFRSAGTASQSTPAWDGMDTWTLDSTTIAGGTGVDAFPSYIDVSAYVRNHVFVAHIDQLLLQTYGGAGLGTLAFDMRDVTITGTLSPERGSFRVDDGVIAGRWPVKDLARTVAAVPDPLHPDGGFLCTGSQGFRILSQVICAKGDISVEAQSGPNAPCDALSFAIAMTAYPALMGAPATAPTPPTTCADAGDFVCP